MNHSLRISIGQYTSPGRKPSNQDFHGTCLPQEPQLSSKGITLALADGISSSPVSHEASAIAVNGFLHDYYCTSEAWSVKKAAESVLTATNSWLYHQNRRNQLHLDKDRGYVCTFSALILKSTTAHLLHVGDARICRLRGHELEVLTQEHRVQVSSQSSYLARAVGMDSHLEMDYHSLALAVGDVFLLMTDGVYEYLTDDVIRTTLHNPSDWQAAAQQLVEHAYAQGSPDNLTLQVVRIEQLPAHSAQELYESLHELPLPPLLEARALFDGYTIVRELHASHRSHVYLALDNATQTQVALKIPSIDMANEPTHIEGFLREEWIARRLNSPHVLKAFALTRPRHYLYTVMEYIEGQTLAQWMRDHPNPDLESVRNIVEQIAKGLRAFHRMEMLHQDLRPANVLIDTTGTVKIIDFGATYVAGLEELSTTTPRPAVLGTLSYSAPEYFLGEGGTKCSDLFALGVITYQMLTGELPYGTAIAKCQTRAAFNQLHYHSALHEKRAIPAWVDDALQKAVAINPNKRYAALSEFLFDLRHPNAAFVNRTRPPLLERNPLRFWQWLALAQAIVIVYLLAK